MSWRKVRVIVTLDADQIPTLGEWQGKKIEQRAAMTVHQACIAAGLNISAIEAHKDRSYLGD